MSTDLVFALEQIEKEKGISKEIIVESIELALVSAYKKNFGAANNVKVNIDFETGTFRVVAIKKVVEVVENPMMEITVEDAKNVDANLAIDDFMEIEVTPKKFGRIAAQTAKQVVMQRLRDAEKGMLYEQFTNKEEEIMNGIVRRVEKKNLVIELEKEEAIIPYSEQIPSEKLAFNDRIKFYVTEVKKTSKGIQIFGSRTHPGLVRRLFELEVPEIYEGIVEVKAISREAGSRTKIAVSSKDENVDPVGACVGQKGNRVQAIVDELKDEKIDIIKWSNDPIEYIASSLSPAKVVKVDILETEKSARVVVPDYQLSLAIGKEGQNARLAAKLTGWKIDIKSQSQVMGDLFATQNETGESLQSEPENEADRLFKNLFKRSESVEVEEDSDKTTSEE